MYFYSINIINSESSVKYPKSRCGMALVIRLFTKYYSELYLMNRAFFLNNLQESILSTVF